ncbi:hypothetical protein WMY93_028521 [Mugilogobius chulae]|uniref:Uncharacterized protein n=1 Tax=Mugilogobius chulae TaxID=88201 RepID=A0AAW0MYY6_9GOBI
MENNNVACKKNQAEKRPATLSTASSPPSAAANLPSRSSTNTRATGPSGRILRRSVSTKK